MTISRAARSHLLTNVLGVLFLAGGLTAGIDAATAKDGDEWKIDGKILGEFKKVGVTDPSEAKKSKDVSGMACTMTDLPRLCLIVDDETQGTQVVILKKDKLEAGEFIPLIGDEFDGKPVELDAEGVAYADGSFYVIGSHGRPRHPKNASGKDKAENDARTKAAGHVFRINFEPDAVDMKTGRIKNKPTIKESQKLNDLIDAQADLAPWVNEDLNKGGLTIEGVAVQDGTLFVGMRGPVLKDGTAFVLEAPVGAVFGDEAGKAELRKLPPLDKDKQGNIRGIRDLVPWGKGLLVLAGPMKDPDDKKYEIRAGDYTIFRWEDGNLTKLKDIDGYGIAKKPEAIVPLEEKGGKLDMLILFDGEEEGKPRLVTVR